MISRMLVATPMYMHGNGSRIPQHKLLSGYEWDLLRSGLIRSLTYYVVTGNWKVQKQAFTATVYQGDVP